MKIRILGGADATNRKQGQQQKLIRIQVTEDRLLEVRMGKAT
jgi:hypothetical protein